MRCLACNCVLSDFDATVKYASTGEYLGLCYRDRRHIPNDVLLIERADLAKDDGYSEEKEFGQQNDDGTEY